MHSKSTKQSTPAVLKTDITATKQTIHFTVRVIMAAKHAECPAMKNYYTQLENSKQDSSNSEETSSNVMWRRIASDSEKSTSSEHWEQGIPEDTITDQEIELLKDWLKKLTVEGNKLPRMNYGGGLREVAEVDWFPTEEIDTHLDLFGNKDDLTSSNQQRIFADLLLSALKETRGLERMYLGCN